jgi:hypothetical protein
LERNGFARSARGAASSRSVPLHEEPSMSGIIYLVGLVVVIYAVLRFFGVV